MKIIYYCHSGVHASVIMAGIHLGLLPETEKIDNAAILALPYFDDRKGNLPGTPLYMGEDEKGNQVYTLAVGNERFLAPKTVRSFLRLFQLDDREVYMVDALKYTAAALKWGGFLSADWGLKLIGRPLVLAAVKKAYPDYVQQVRRLKQELGYLQ